MVNVVRSERVGTPTRTRRRGTPWAACTVRSASSWAAAVRPGSSRR